MAAQIEVLQMVMPCDPEKANKLQPWLDTSSCQAEQKLCSSDHKRWHEV